MNEARTADRLAIGELLSRYAWSLADRDWSAWQACFTADAHADYTTAGGVAGTPADAAAWLEQTMSMFDVAVGHTGNVVIDFLDDDTAAVRSMYKMVMRIPGDAPTYMEACGYYRDKVVRDRSGWLLADRVEHLLYIR
ncbi:MAG TPA: nuclear transport factor 2 family protein [Ilumatobacteraceae bacterium]|nr:nuclear transport factor 2 family protein [Ilumatobacteraceae bacterium]